MLRGVSEKARSKLLDLLSSTSLRSPVVTIITHDVSDKLRSDEIDIAVYDKANIVEESTTSFGGLEFYIDPKVSESIGDSQLDLNEAGNFCLIAG